MAGLLLGSIFLSTPLRADDQPKPVLPTTHPSLLLNDVVQLVLKHNPELKAASLDIRGASARHQYAGQFENPILGVALEDFMPGGPQSGNSATQTTLALTQSFPMSGRLGASKALSAAQLSVAQARAASLQVSILAETVVRFLHVVADQHRFEVAIRASALSAQGVDVAKRRGESGATSVVEERRANIALAYGKLDEEHAEHELLASKRRLSMMWGEADAHFESVAANLFAPRTLPTYEALAARIQNNPELNRLARAQTVQRATLSFAESTAVPDIKLNVGTRRLQSEDAFALVFGLSMPIPLFQRNQGAISSAQLKHSEIGAQQAAMRVRLLADIYGHTQEMNHAKEVLDVLGNTMLPDAKAVLEVVTHGFTVGRFSQIELLNAQQTLIDLERKRIDGAEELLRLLVRINSILGATELTPGVPQLGPGSPKPKRR